MSSQTITKIPCNVREISDRLVRLNQTGGNLGENPDHDYWDTLSRKCRQGAYRLSGNHQILGFHYQIS